MGFESSRAARRRLATIATTNDRVSEALSPSTYTGFFGDAPPARSDESARQSADLSADPSTALARQLDLLAHDIVATPGAGGALLAAFASQTRALLMVVEAASRAGTSPLPAAVVMAARAALCTPATLSALPRP